MKRKQTNGRTRRRGRIAVRRIAFVGVMAAMICAVSYLAFPLFGSRVHFGNTLCLLSGLLFGPWLGGLSAGLGSFLFDVISGYDFVEALITFGSKFIMAMTAGLILGIVRRADTKRRTVFAVIGSVTGAWVYVALYMVKSFFKNQIVAGLTPDAALTAALLEKLPASALNAVFAMVCAPLLWLALLPVTRRYRLD